ncbi:MAG TPA: sigma factor-like helix-turn-helix DNA-binding protein [Acidimicrobiales bacterium]|nr:sigma factor-like helix-turn-helix DNA-binding protein [Acidimicrobiales bacterium]
MTGSREVGEDIAHDVFLRVEPKWHDITEPVPYLRHSVVNAARSHHRRRGVERRHLPVPPEATVNPQIDEVWSVVGELPKRQRHALVLRFYLDLTVEQVAVQLDCPLGTAKSLIHRGLAQIKERIGQ